MSKCSQCKKQEVEDSLWDRFRLFLFYRLFPNDVQDTMTDSILRGYGAGYDTGRKHEREQYEANQAILNDTYVPVPKNTII